MGVCVCENEGRKEGGRLSVRDLFAVNGRVINCGHALYIASLAQHVVDTRAMWYVVSTFLHNSCQGYFNTMNVSSRHKVIGSIQENLKIWHQYPCPQLSTSNNVTAYLVKSNQWKFLNFMIEDA